MLNELYQVASTPDLKQLFISEQDKRLKPLPKVTENSPAFRVCMGETSIITSIKKMDKSQIVPLRKFEVSNGFSFPSFNLPPYLSILRNKFEEAYILYQSPDLIDKFANIEGKERDKLISKSFKGSFNQLHLIEFVTEFNEKLSAEDTHQKYLASVTNKIDKCLHEASQKLWESMNFPCDVPLSIKLLYKRVTNVSIADFRKAVATMALAKITTYEDWEQLYDLLVLNQAIKTSIPGVSVVLDIDDYDENGYPVAHEKTIQWINDKLLNSRNEIRETESQDTSQVDAFGNHLFGHNEKMPSVRMPITGDVILRSMVKESPCQYRYRKVDSLAFPVGDDSRKMAKAALETLSQKDLRGFTWEGLGNQGILFAYPSEIPKKEKIPVAKFMTGSGTEESFKGLSAKVIGYLSGINKSLASIEMRVFALKKMDRARTKVVYYLNFSAQRLKESAEEWQNGSVNIPQLRIKEWGESKGEVIVLGMITPFPVEIAEIINKIWKYDGSLAGVSKSVNKTIGIDLLIKEYDKALTRYLLDLLIRNSSVFLICLGQACHINKVFGEKRQFKNDKVLIPATLGLLLYKLGCKKEDYMKDSAYLIGNLMAVTDELHYLYCKHVRTSEEDRKVNKVNTPTQLLGNAHMISALESPIRTLSVLANRIMPYISWAKSNNSEDVGLSRYLCKQYREIATQISSKPIPKRLNDEDRAALLLGYLAGAGNGNEKISNKEEK